ncbi:MAG: hypothetical protein QHH75_13035 [Bacillota bacterium]|nr:hypothetical protein [Bacillota bacterium]
MDWITDYENIDPADLEDVSATLEKIMNQSKGLSFDFDHGKECEPGKGFVTESLFVATKRAIFWVVILKHHKFAFMRVTPEWIKAYGNIILLSPEIFVEFNRHRRIIEWTAEQDKVIDKK